jgi:two-component system cell cycle response regulator CpdR
VRVLVVDDHRSTRETLALGFARLGHEADVAASATDAIEKLQEQSYAWMICDVRMPDASGIDVAVAARKQQPQLALILMTAYEVSEQERRILESLGGTLVIKPATAAALAMRCAGMAAPPAREETHS